MTVDMERPTSRRAVLAGAVGGAGMALAARFADPSAAQAANGDNAILGAANTSTTQTSFESTTSGQVSLAAIHTDGSAIIATVTSGLAVTAEATSGTALHAATNSGTAVEASTGDGYAVNASNSNAWNPTLKVTNASAVPGTFTNGSFGSAVLATLGETGTPGADNSIVGSSQETAVYAYSNISSSSNGVWGDSWDGTGVYGTGSWGVYGAGYDGVTGVGAHFGVHAIAGSASAYALYTEGKIKFAGRSGRTSITSGHQYKDVTISGMTTSSAVIVTLQTYKSGFAVAAAISYSGKFRLYLNKAATSTIYFSYLVIG